MANTVEFKEGYLKFAGFDNIKEFVLEVRDKDHAVCIYPNIEKKTTGSSCRVKLEADNTNHLQSLVDLLGSVNGNKNTLNFLKVGEGKEAFFICTEE
jgi:hypothetical protein